MIKNNNNFFADLAGVNEDSKDNYSEDIKLVSSSAKSLDEKQKKITKEEKSDENITLNKDNLDYDDDYNEIDDVEGQLLIDVYQDANNIYIESPVAGVELGDLDISITPESVSIKGSRKKEKKIKKDEYLYKECFWGSFSRSVILPQEIDTDKASAALKNGVLRISLPKMNRLKRKKINIKID